MTKTIQLHLITRENGLLVNNGYIQGDIAEDTVELANVGTTLTPEALQTFGKFLNGLNAAYKREAQQKQNE